MSGTSSFWDRRRAGVAAEERAVQQAEEARADERAVAEFADKSDEEVLAALDLPDPDTLKMGDDFSAFLSRAVPLHLRNRALRRLWRSNPVLACVDGLNDYDTDFLTGSTGNGTVKTAYQVGKGMLSHLVELERQADKVATAAAEPEIAQDPAPDEVVEGAGVVEEAPQSVLATLGEADHPDERPTPAPRRMTFHFDGETA